MATKAAYLTALAGEDFIEEIGTAVEVTDESITEIHYIGVQKEMTNAQ